MQGTPQRITRSRAARFSNTRAVDPIPLETSYQGPFAASSNLTNLWLTREQKRGQVESPSESGLPLSEANLEKLHRITGSGPSDEMNSITSRKRDTEKIFVAAIKHYECDSGNSVSAVAEVTIYSFPISPYYSPQCKNIRSPCRSNLGLTLLSSGQPLKRESANYPVLQKLYIITSLMSLKDQAEKMTVSSLSTVLFLPWTVARNSTFQEKQVSFLPLSLCI